MKVFCPRSALKVMGMRRSIVDFIVDLNKLLKTNKFNSIIISVLIILFMISTQQAFNHFKELNEFLFYCCLDAIR